MSNWKILFNSILNKSNQAMTLGDFIRGIKKPASLILEGQMVKAGGSRKTCTRCHRPTYCYPIHKRVLKEDFLATCPESWFSSNYNKLFWKFLRFFNYCSDKLNVRRRIMAKLTIITDVRIFIYIGWINHPSKSDDLEEFWAIWDRDL